jgi:hypothetical protein
MKRYFYFRTVTAIGDDDNIDDSILVPVDSLLQFQVDSDTQIRVSFLPLTYGDANHDGAKLGDTVLLTIKASSMFRVMKALCEATNEGPHHNGIVTIGDDVTATYLTEDITAVSTISNAGIIAYDGN